MASNRPQINLLEGGKAEEPRKEKSGSEFGIFDLVFYKLRFFMGNLLQTITLLLTGAFLSIAFLDSFEGIKTMQFVLRPDTISRWVYLGVILFFGFISVLLRAK